MSDPAYSPSFDETGPFAPDGDDTNARTNPAIAPDPNVEPSFTSELDADILLTTDPAADVWNDVFDTDEAIIQGDETNDDDSLDEFGHLDDALDEDDDELDDDNLDEDDLEDILDIGEAEDELDEVEDELLDDELDDAAAVENDLAADSAALDDELDDDDDGPRPLSDTQPL